MGELLKMPRPQFAHSCASVGGMKLIISTCTFCGRKQISSDDERSLVDWEHGHVCASSERIVKAFQGKDRPQLKELGTASDSPFMPNGVATASSLFAVDHFPPPTLSTIDVPIDIRGHKRKAPQAGLERTSRRSLVGPILHPFVPLRYDFRCGRAPVDSRHPQRRLSIRQTDFVRYQRRYCDRLLGVPLL
jgi:hypothetical protein